MNVLIGAFVEFISEYLIEIETLCKTFAFYGRHLYTKIKIH